MSLADTFRNSVRHARDFLRKKDANVAMIFAISIIPVVIAAGAGLDLARSMIVKSALSEALDASALAAASTPGATQAQMQTAAQNYFNANYKVDSTFGAPTALTVSKNGQSVTVSTSVPMPTTLMNVAGISTVNVASSSTVVWGQTKLWVSLVLDNTGSMCQSDANPNAGSPCPNPSSDTKIASLQTATHSLLTMLQNSAVNAGDVQVAIAPFVKDVNVGTGNVGASWIDWTDWDAANGTCSVSNKHSQASCQAVTGTWTPGSCNISGINTQSTCTTTHGTWNNNRCNISGYNTRTTCQNAVGTWTAGSCNFSGYTTQSTCQAATAVWTPSAHSNWNGCVMDRGTDAGPDTTNNWDVMKTSPDGTTASKFPAEQYSNCPQSLASLSFDWTSLGSKVDAMVAGGSTNQTIGLVWGWHALSTGDPLNASSVPANTSRYIIILSDGLNTQDRWYGNGSTQSTSVDNRMSAVCTNAKADGIVIYAVFVDIGGTQGNSTVLQNCATDSTKYYDLTSASQIQNALNAIGEQITNLRVAQ